jgi:hypothetical protein
MCATRRRNVMKKFAERALFDALSRELMVGRSR